MQHIILIAPPGNGKTTLVNLLTENETPLLIDGDIHAFSFSRVTAQIKTIIIDGITNHSILAKILNSPFLTIERKGKEPLVMDTPRFIICTQKMDKDIINSIHNKLVFKIEKYYVNH